MKVIMAMSPLCKHIFTVTEGLEWVEKKRKIRVVESLSNKHSDNMKWPKK
jgi:hypothetical protein